MRGRGHSTDLAGVESLFQEPHDEHFFKIKLPPISMNLRRSGRHRTASAGASGSEYLASEKSLEMQRPTPPPEPTVEFTQSRSGRRVIKKTYVESSDSEVAHPEEIFDEEHEDLPPRNSRPPKTRRALPDDEDEEEAPVGRRLRNRSRLGGFIVEDEDEKMHTHGRYPIRNRNKKTPPNTNGSSKPRAEQPQESQRSRRLTRRNASRVEQEEDFFPEPHTSSDAELDPEPEREPEPELEEEVDERPYALRQRQKINYAIPPPLEDMPKPATKNTARRQGGRAGGYYGGGHGRAGAKGRTLGWSASGAELGRWMGDDSVIIFFSTISKPTADIHLGFRLWHANPQKTIWGYSSLWSSRCRPCWEWNDR
jgi:ATPase family AAA domain-containing protein 2